MIDDQTIDESTPNENEDKEKESMKIDESGIVRDTSITGNFLDSIIDASSGKSEDETSNEKPGNVIQTETEDEYIEKMGSLDDEEDEEEEGEDFDGENDNVMKDDEDQLEILPPHMMSIPTKMVIYPFIHYCQVKNNKKYLKNPKKELEK
eukprot:CAMPEP_0117425880 /NCGR_PEP_ID=MMETSP0758-20121206/6096_1 /TAXON_ID=63605 /ORGANISM="Percolomonas cosmopolitus, Strain AE-1 (ATCC 50343)" /LENGTH=149 /DNA_ID=CAMNT_0005210695 /DNA_START=569 /DNA_END=1019 /DNA_ORIENTATION=+